MQLNREIRKIPFFRLILPFIAGILLQLAYNFDKQILVLFFSISVIILIIYLIITDKKLNYHQRWIFGLLLSFVLLSLSATITSLKKNKNSIILSSEHFIAIVNEAPKQTKKSIKLIVKTKSFFKDSIWQTHKANIIIYLKKDSLAQSLTYGDKILCKTNLNEIKNSGNPNEFNYKKYLANKQIYFQTYLKNNQWKLLEHNKGNFIFSTAFKIRNNLLQVYKKNNISGDEFAILAALTLGVKDYLSNDIVESYSISGAMHILAVSGLHVGIIYLVLSNLFFFLRKKKSLIIIQSAIFIIIIWLFALITGLSPSVTRASTMLSFIIIGKASHRQPSTYNSLTASAFIILAINPFAITYVGFQLSYLAVIAIVFFQPKIYRLFEINNGIIDKIWQLTSVSIAAQIGTAVISIYYFHQFPVYFLLTNIIAIPAAFIILLLAIFLLLTNFIPFIPYFIAILLTYTIIVLNFLTKAIENLNFSSITNISLSNSEVILFYVAISFFIIFYITKKKKIIFFSLILILISLTLHNFRYFKQSNSNKFIVFNLKGKSAIAILQQQKCDIYVDSILIANTNSLDYLTGNLIANNFITEIDIKPINIKKHNNFLFTNNLRIAILNNSNLENFSTDRKLKLDFIVISKGFNVNIGNLNDLFEFKKVILDSSIPKWHEETILRDCVFEKIDVFNTKTDGAFINEFAY